MNWKDDPARVADPLPYHNSVLQSLSAGLWRLFWSASRSRSARERVKGCHFVVRFRLSPRIYWMFWRTGGTSIVILGHSYCPTPISRSAMDCQSLLESSASPPPLIPRPSHEPISRIDCSSPAERGFAVASLLAIHLRQHICSISD